MQGTPSKRIKRLYDKRTSDEDMSLKDFAVDLVRDGTAEEKQLAEDWFAAKS